MPAAISESGCAQKREQCSKSGRWPFSCSQRFVICTPKVGGVAFCVLLCAWTNLCSALLPSRSCLWVAKGLYHRDLKPDNIVMTKAGLPLLIDFELMSFDRALSGVSAASSTFGFVGTRWYAAPESLNDAEHKPKRTGLEKEVP